MTTLSPPDTCTQCSKLWGQERVPNINLMVPVRLHQLQKRELGSDTEAAGTLRRLQRVGPHWFTEGDGPMHRHLTTTEMDDCEPRRDFIRARRKREVFTESRDMCIEKNSKRVSKRRVEMTHVLTRPKRQAHLLSKECEHIVGQLACDELLGPEVASFGYVWERQDTLMVHVQPDGNDTPAAATRRSELKATLEAQHTHHG